MGKPSDELLPRADPEALNRAFGVQFEACERLLRLAWSERPGSYEIRQPHQYIAASILGRGFSTYQGGLELCRLGLPVQATMLARSLFEDVISMLWASMPEHREIVLDRVRAKDAHRALVEQRLRGDPIDPDLLDRADELDRLFGKSGARSWFGSLWGAVNEVEPYWVSLGGESGILIDYYNVINRYANER